MADESLNKCGGCVFWLLCALFVGFVRFGSEVHGGHGVDSLGPVSNETMLYSTSQYADGEQACPMLFFRAETARSYVLSLRTKSKDDYGVYHLSILCDAVEYAVPPWVWRILREPLRQLCGGSECHFGAHWWLQGDLGQLLLCVLRSVWAAWQHRGGQRGSICRLVTRQCRVLRGRAMSKTF